FFLLQQIAALFVRLLGVLRGVQAGRADGHTFHIPEPMQDDGSQIGIIESTTATEVDHIRPETRQRRADFAAHQIALRNAVAATPAHATEAPRVHSIPASGPSLISEAAESASTHSPPPAPPSFPKPPNPPPPAELMLASWSTPWFWPS